MPRSVLVGAAALVALLAWVGIAASGQTDEFAALPAAPSAPDGEGDVAEADGAAPRRGGERISRSGERPGQTFARAGDVDLTLASREVTRVGFAEAENGTAQVMAPVGTLVENASEDKFAPGEDQPGPEYSILPPRGQPWPATSSAALVLPRRSRVSAPVSGEVTEVAPYPMADGAKDVRVRIVPSAAPDIAVEVRHLAEVDVSPGTEVEAGRTRLGVVRSVAIDHPADPITGEDEAHLRVEVRPARAPAAPDPNASAEEGDAG